MPDRISGTNLEGISRARLAQGMDWVSLASAKVGRASCTPPVRRDKKEMVNPTPLKEGLHVGVNGSIRRDGDVRDEVVRNTEEAEMLDGEQGNHHVESDGLIIQGVLHPQNHSGRNDGFLENPYDNAAGKDDQMLLEEDEGSPAF